MNPGRISLQITCLAYNQNIQIGTEDLLGVAKATNVRAGYCVVNCPQCGGKQERSIASDVVSILLYAGVPEMTPRLTEEEIDQFMVDLEAEPDPIKALQE